MMNNELHNRIDEIANRIKQNGDVSAYLKDRSVSPIVRLLMRLNDLPKANVPTSALARVRSQVLSRIAASEKTFSPAFVRVSYFTRVLKLSTAVLGSLLIVTSLTVGVAVAALQSVPGQPIYPLKKIVENVQLKLAHNEQERAKLQLQFAANRLDELEAVLTRTEDKRIDAEEIQKLVQDAVKNVESGTSAAVSAAQTSEQNKPKVSLANQLVELNNKLQSALVDSEGDVKIELEKALEISRISKEQAIANLERAGLKLEATPISIEEKPATDHVKANGKITALNETSVSIASVKFLLTKDTLYTNLKFSDLKLNLDVSIEGVIKDGKTYAVSITLEMETDVVKPDTELPAEPATDEAQ